jgi:hypothetical protein
MISPELAAKFPRLSADGATETSPADPVYNCLAWSAKRDKTIWWEPGGQTGTYWPEGVRDDRSFECFVDLFEKLGYKKCNGSHFEFFYKKVALYSTPAWGFSHVCDQLNSGAWTSKLSEDKDIEHNSLECLEGSYPSEFGEVKQILKKRCNAVDILARMAFNIRSFFRR